MTTTEEAAAARLHDTFKHLTTLSTGSILILATFLDKFFASPEWNILIAFIFLPFTVSIIFSVLSMFFFASMPFVEKPAQRLESLVHTFEFTIIFSVVGFLTGITSLVIFVLKNFY